MARRWITHEQAYSELIDSIHSLTAELDKENKRLKDTDDYDEITQLEHTKSIIGRWFFNHGGLPI